MTPFCVTVLGRPAPQGSKVIRNTAMRDASAYLPAWRNAVVVACFEAYRLAGVAPEALPLIPGPVTVDLRFRIDSRFDGPPDVDKLARAVLDALGPPVGKRRGARVFEDDSRVVLLIAAKMPGGGPTGCRIEVAPFYGFPPAAAGWED